MLSKRLVPCRYIRQNHMPSEGLLVIPQNIFFSIQNIKNVITEYTKALTLAGANISLILGHFQKRLTAKCLIYPLSFTHGGNP